MPQETARWDLPSSRLYNTCDRLLDQERIGSSVILIIMEDFSTALTMALLTVTFLFALRWHMPKRIEHFGILGHKL